MLDRIRSKLGGLRQGRREDALCILPWIHLHARTDGTVLPCCVADESCSIGSLHKSPAVKLFNARRMRKLRLDMLAGRRNPTCTRCYQLEDAGGESLRQLSNHAHSRHADKVEQTARNGSVSPGRITYLDIRFSNLCNLRCRTCGPAASTAWYQDEPATAPPDFRILRAGRTTEGLWTQIEPFLPQIEVMHFAGGEPMLMDETYLTLEKLLELGRTDVRLTYNTNCTTWTYRNWNALEMWKRFDSVEVMASLDGSGPRGEYIRKGLNWKKALNNCLRLRHECPQVRFQVNCTLGVLNALHLPEFLDDCLTSGLIEPDELYLNVVQDPLEMSLTSLPPALKDKVRASYEQQRLRFGPDSPLGSRLAEAISYMDSCSTTERLVTFRRRTLEFDAKRRESFTETFPELADLMVAPGHEAG